MASARGIRAGKAYVEVSADLGLLERGLDAARKRLGTWGASLQAGGLRVAAGGLAIAGGFGLALRTLSKYGDEIEKGARRTGILAEDLSRLSFAAEQSGADLATFEKSVARMSRTLEEARAGTKSAVDALAAVGITVEELNGLTPDQQFLRMADALAAVDDPGQRAARAMEIFGRGGVALLPMLMDGADGIRALTDQAERFGLTVSTKTAKDAAALTDALNLLRRASRAVVMEIGAGLAPGATKAGVALAHVAAASRRWIEENRGVVVGVALATGGAIALGGTLIGLGIALKVVAFGLSGIVGLAALVTGALTAVKVAAVATGAALAASLTPFGLFAAAAVAAGAAALHFGGVLGDLAAFSRASFADLSTQASDTLKGIARAIQAGDIEAAVELLWASIKLAWAKGVGEVRKLMNELMNDGKRVFAFLDDALTAGAQGGGNLLVRGLLNAQKALGLIDDDELERRLQTLREIADNDASTRRSNLNDKLTGIDAKERESLKKIEDEVTKAKDKYDKILKRVNELPGPGDSPVLGRRVGPEIDYDLVAQRAARASDFVRSSFGAGNAAQVFGGAGPGAGAAERQTRTLESILAEQREQRRLQRETLDALNRAASQGGLVFA